VCTLPHSVAFGGRVVGRGFRNANRIEIAGTKTSLYVRSPLSHTG
jgi:hypothetical protein